jgi:hypothetical protein
MDILLISSGVWGLFTTTKTSETLHAYINDEAKKKTLTIENYHAISEVYWGWKDDNRKGSISID